MDSVPVVSSQHPGGASDLSGGEANVDSIPMVQSQTIDGVSGLVMHDDPGEEPTLGLSSVATLSGDAEEAVEPPEPPEPLPRQGVFESASLGNVEVEKDDHVPDDNKATDIDNRPQPEHEVTEPAEQLSSVSVEEKNQDPGTDSESMSGQDITELAEPVEPPPSVSDEEANKALGSDNESKELNELKVILIGARRLPIMDTSMFNRG